MPAQLWKINLRLLLRSSSWDKLRKETYKNTNNLCEICYSKSRKHPVECHKKWYYNNEQKIQTLKGTIALCPMCHKTKHFEMAQKIGIFEQVKTHFSKVNNVSKTEAINYFNEKMRKFD